MLRKIPAVLTAAILLTVMLFASCTASVKPELPETVSESTAFAPEESEEEPLPSETEESETFEESEETLLPEETESEPAEETASETVSETESESAPESEKPAETVKETEKKTEKKEEAKDTGKKTESAKADSSKDKTDSTPKYKYYLTVDRAGNTVTVYTYDEDGNYTKPVFSMICSTGPGTPKKGVYNIRNTNHYVWHALYGHVYGHYVTQIRGDILFHSVPYRKSGDHGSLKYEEFDKLGTSCSMGCVRLQVKDAKWIYDNRKNVSGVEFTNTGSTGPLGRPSAPKISGNEECRGWDPTDPDPDNPWKKGSADKTSETEVLTETEPVSETDPASEEPAESEETAETESESTEEAETSSESEKPAESEKASESEKPAESEKASESEKPRDSGKTSESEKPKDSESGTESEKP